MSKHLWTPGSLITSTNMSLKKITLNRVQDNGLKSGILIKMEEALISMPECDQELGLTDFRLAASTLPPRTLFKKTFHCPQMQLAYNSSSLSYTLSPTIYFHFLFIFFLIFHPSVILIRQMSLNFTNYCSENSVK